MSAQTGTLYIVSTPIGNLSDITYRAVDTLKHVDLIAAEDTRHSRKLLSHYNINTPLASLHKYNEQGKSNTLLKLLQQGKSIALISDAGTPLISDPGYPLVLKAQGKFRVIPIPGASAIITALSAAGLPADQFCFRGFLSPKSSAREKQLQQLVSENQTLIFYEAPHRLISSLKAMLKVFSPDRSATIARELTKTFEQIKTDTLENLLNLCLNQTIPCKGEFVILVAGNNSLKSDQKEKTVNLENVLQPLIQSLSLKQSVELTQKITSEKRSKVYKIALQLKKALKS